MWAYLYTKQTFTPDPTWATRIYQKCPRIQPGKKLMFNDNSLLISCLSCAIYTGYLGTIAQRWVFGVSWEGMLKTDLFTGFKRLVITSAMSAPFGLLFIAHLNVGLWTALAIKTFAFLGFALVTSACASSIFHRFGLLNYEQKQRIVEIEINGDKETMRPLS